MVDDFSETETSSIDVEANWPTWTPMMMTALNACLGDVGYIYIYMYMYIYIYRYTY